MLYAEYLGIYLLSMAKLRNLMILMLRQTRAHEDTFQFVSLVYLSYLNFFQIPPGSLRNRFHRKLRFSPSVSVVDQNIFRVNYQGNYQIRQMLGHQSNYGNLCSTSAK